MQFNADTATNYDDYRLEGSGAAQAVALENLAVAGIRLGFFPGTTATANFVGVASATIHNYRGTTYNKAVEASGFDAIATSSTNLFREAAGGTWKNTAAITSIQLVPVSGSFIAGSRFTLYGLT
jgi:hypothetical protein